jgi:DNA-binding transcriptional MerR regulator
MGETQYLIGELANMSGITIRTIRYYMDEELLPPPQQQGRYAYFNETYISRLKLIQRLKDAYLPLKEIKRILDRLTGDEIKVYMEKNDLTELGIPGVIPSPNSLAVDYIENVMKNQIRDKSASPILSQPFSPPPNTGNFTSKESSMQQEGSNWRRIELRKGIELHIDEKLILNDGGRIFSIIEHFKRVLRSEL